MDQYIKVIFPTRRKVLIDDTPAGFTNSVFQVEAGNHTITLGQSKKNYSPEEQNVNVTGTMASEPLIVVFTRTDI